MRRLGPAVIMVGLLLAAMPTPVLALSFELQAMTTVLGVPDETTGFSPKWVLTNTSPDRLGFSGEVTPFATLDFGTLPIVTGTFLFQDILFSGITLEPGESVGQTRGSFDATPPLVEPTIDVTRSFGPLFNVDGDYVRGFGVGTMTFGLRDSSTGISAIVDMPLTIVVVGASAGAPVQFFTSTLTSRNVGEPGTAILLCAFVLGLFGYRRRPAVGEVGRKAAVIPRETEGPEGLPRQGRGRPPHLD
jgi:hypothetical protein